MKTEQIKNNLSQEQIIWFNQRNIKTLDETKLIADELTQKFISERNEFGYWSEFINKLICLLLQYSDKGIAISGKEKERHHLNTRDFAKLKYALQEAGYLRILHGYPKSDGSYQGLALVTNFDDSCLKHAKESAVQKQVQLKKTIEDRLRKIECYKLNV